jgi:exosome complex exonuclease RRP6
VKPDNNYDTPAWQPTLEYKHHAMVPLDYVPTPASSRAGTPFFGETGSNDGTMSRDPVKPDFTKHPYYHETKHLPYPSSLFTNKPAVPVQPFASTPFTYVETEDQYRAMATKLQAVDEIAVDLEYHATRSFTGFLCLMQISTRDEDFVVDLLALRDLVRRDKLGGVLVNPAIVKVFHGAESDILWLQQDFDIYVVGMFDTYHATKVLSAFIVNLTTSRGGAEFPPTCEYRLPSTFARFLASALLRFRC